MENNDNKEIKNSVFNSLNVIDANDKIKEISGKKKVLKYIPWASAWAAVKKIYPDAYFTIYPQVMDNFGNERFWHEDGKSGWVQVGVTINGLELIEILSIMDYQNNAIPAEKITSSDANKSIKRCLVKTIALHGYGLYIYEGEDIPNELSKVLELRENIKRIATKKCELSEKAKEKVGELCREAERNNCPWMEEADIVGNYNNIEDVEALEKLEKKLLTVRK